MGLFTANKPNMTRLNHKDEYYKNYYFNRKLCNGIRIVADIERTSKKQAAELLMRAGLSSYMDAKLTEHIERERAARELNQKVKATRFLRELRKLAKSKSMDISKFI
jgi:hypothetical protein